MQMCFDDRAVDQEQRFVIDANAERESQRLPVARDGPPPKSPVDRRPLAELLRKVAPRRPRSRDPDNRLDEPSIVTPTWTAKTEAGDERGKLGPFLVGQR